ncbi:MAG: hypothetical protein ACPGYL_15400, partial [Rhodospirillaceae bacterium]
MTLTGRLVVLVTVCVALTTAAIAATTGLLATNGLIQQAEGTARTLAGLIAESATRSDLVLAEQEAQTGEEMIAQGLALAHLAEALLDGGGTAEELTGRFAEIAAKSGIGDIWLLDSDLSNLAASVGAYYGLTDPGPPPPTLSDQALKALTDGRRFALVAGGQEITERPVAAVRLSGGRALVLAHPPTAQR